MSDNKVEYSVLATSEDANEPNANEYNISIIDCSQEKTAAIADLPTKEGAVKITSARQSITYDRKSQVKRSETGKTVRVVQDKYAHSRAVSESVGKSLASSEATDTVYGRIWTARHIMILRYGVYPFYGALVVLLSVVALLVIASSGVILPSIMYYNLAHVVVGVAGTLMLDATVTTSIWALRQQVSIDLVSSSADFELVDNMFGLSNALDVYKVAYQWISSVSKLPKQERRLRRTNTPRQVIYCLSVAIVAVLSTILVEATMDWEPEMTALDKLVPCSAPVFSMEGLEYFLDFNNGLEYANGVVDMVTSMSLGDLMPQSTVGVYKWTEAQTPGTQQLVVDTLGYSIDVTCTADGLSAQHAEYRMDDVTCNSIACAFNVTLYGYNLNSTNFSRQGRAIDESNSGRLAECQVALEALNITLQISYLVGPKLRAIMQQNIPLAVNSIGPPGSGFLAQRAIQSMNRQVFTKSPGMTGGVASWLKLGTGLPITSLLAQKTVTAGLAGSLFMISQAYVTAEPRSCLVLTSAGAGTITIPQIAIWLTTISCAVWLFLMISTVSTINSDTLLSTPAIVARGAAALTSGVRFAALLNDSQPFTELCQNLCDSTPSEVRKRIGHQRITLGAERQPVGDSKCSIFV
ncbi:UNVERIFIED_CONTAM: hypothetical protein HDU68_002934 [Siphonaria sp. JEL0065]|nr:hypothetical protein HDU68_002934 [Siphonaria sp. JEL0065]